MFSESITIIYYSPFKTINNQHRLLDTSESFGLALILFILFDSLFGLVLVCGVYLFLYVVIILGGAGTDMDGAVDTEIDASSCIANIACANN